MEEKKQMKKEISKLGFMLVIGTAAIYALQYAVAFFVQNYKPEWLQNTTSAMIVTMIPMYVIGMPFMIFLITRIKGTTIEKKQIKVWQFFLSFLMIWTLMYFSNLFGVLVTGIVGLLKGSPVINPMMEIATSTNPVFNIIVMVIIAPIYEEFIFRKLLVDRLVKYGEGVAVVMSGLIFGLFHGNLNQFVYAFVIGAGFAFLYVKTGKMYITVLLHMMINFMGSVLSVSVMKLAHLEEYMEVAKTGDVTKVMEFVQKYGAGFAAYMVYAMVIFAMVIAGFVLLIVNRKKIKFAAPVLAKGEKFKTVMLNPGMIVLCVGFIVMILIQMLQG